MAQIHMSTTQALLLQQKLANKVITRDALPKKLKLVCGVDASYKNGKVHCSAVIFD